MTASVISCWHPIASIVTMQSSRSNARISMGIAVISLLLSSTFTWPRDMPFATDQAETIHSLNPSLPVGCLSSHLLEPRISLPSIATTPLISWQTCFTQLRKISSKYSGFIMLKNRLNVSWLGIVSKSGRRLLKKSNFALPNASISFQDWAPQIVAAMDIYIMVSILCTFLRSIRGSSICLQMSIIPIFMSIYV